MDKKKVLFVDDNKMDRLILSKILEQLELDYKETATAEEFLSQIKSYDPDLCLVDLNISQNNDGRVLVRAVRNILGQSLPIIIISAVEESEEIALNLKNGANDFVCKPIDKALLSSKIANYLHNKEIDSRVLPLFRLPKTQNGKITMALNYDLVSMSETEIGFKSEVNLTKGSRVIMRNNFLTSIIEDEELTVEITDVRDGIFYGVVQELTEEFRPALRIYLAKNQKLST